MYFLIIIALGLFIELLPLGNSKIFKIIILTLTIG